MEKLFCGWSPERGGGEQKRRLEREGVRGRAMRARRRLKQDRKGVRFEFRILPAGCSDGQVGEGLC